MADSYGNDSAVQATNHCMPSRLEKSNVDAMNKMMGYNNPSDRANTGMYPSALQGAKVNTQPMK